MHFFVFTLGFSRRAVAYAYRNERLDTLLDGHEGVWFANIPIAVRITSQTRRGLNDVSAFRRR